jgi:hypothetical protein
MSTVYAALILGALSFLVWVIWFTSARSKGKGLLQNFRVIAEKYSFEIDESSRSGKLVMPVLRGIYKKHQLEIGCSPGTKNNCSTYTKVECQNNKNISFSLLPKGKTYTPSGSAVMSLMDSEFDDKFAVSSETPDYVISLFTFNVKYSLLQAQDLGLRGELKLQGNKLSYVEPDMIKDESSRTRIELVMHILCDIADELEKY